MITMLSLVTSVKDYIEIAHKLIETQNTNYFVGTSSPASNLTESFFGIRDYNEFGAILTYSVISIKEFLINFFTFAWLNNIWSLPLIVPDITSAMISEISVLDSYFTNAFSFLDNGVSSTLSITASGSNQNTFLFGFEKFMIGLFNSFFLFLPTSTAHLITVRRFVMQGIEAGFIAGLGTIAGNFFWLASIILGLRFFVIPWLSLDIFRYILGFMLLVKYLWDSSKELNKSKTNLEESTKIQIFLLNFLLALTEQTSIYPFISNMSFGAEGSIIEGFSGTIFQSENFLQFFGIHSCYLLGILLGSFSLLQFTVWFWENPAFSIYMWMISSYRVTTSSYYKVLNFIFLYLTMLCAISSIPYFGLDYTISNPLGLIPQDRMIDQKIATANGPGENILPEASFLSVKPTDKNTRIRDGIHARRERWKERLIKYQAFDASLYEQGVYDILTVEDLNYGFDRFWLRRKMRNHQIRFRLFPGPWMRSLKKQLNKPGFSGPRMEFFRILFEQYYHPSFHSSAVPNKKLNSNSLKSNVPIKLSSSSAPLMLYGKGTDSRLDNSSSVITSTNTSNTDQGNVNLLRKNNIYNFKTKKGLISEYSALRKFSRNVTTRLNASSLANLSSPLRFAETNNFKNAVLNNGIDSGPSSSSKRIYSKSLKSLFTQINKDYTKTNLTTFRTISKTLLLPNFGKNTLENLNYNNINSNSFTNLNLPTWGQQIDNGQWGSQSLKKTSIRKKLSKKERFLLLAKSNYTQNIANSLGASDKKAESNPLNYTMDIPLQPLNFYVQKNEAFKRKLKYYSTATTRTFSVGNNAPYFKTILKRAFYYHKPSLRWKRTMFTAAMRRGFRKKSVNPKKIQYNTNNLTTSLVNKSFPLPANNNELSAQQNSGASSQITEKEAQAFLMAPQQSSVANQQYSVLGKRASRYRYQIYKDVLQHWYYTPFNRLLLKYDIDSFINRQPKAHFLTKNEEQLLHLRRILLSEHYNTLRWYTYMQHYRTMKARIGGTKSFASTAYNQQFQGSFKKIRHLFAITPIQAHNASSSQDMSVLQGKNSTYGSSGLQNDYGGVGAEGPSILKFDQPLYNEYNKQKSSGLTASIYPQGELTSGSNGNLSKSKKVSGTLPSAYKHEDLSKSGPTDRTVVPRAPGEIGTQPNDLIDESLNITGTMIQIEQSKKQILIKEYINQKNYTALTNLLNNNYNIMNPVVTTPNQTKNAFVGRENVKDLPVLLEGNGEDLNTKLLLLDLLKQCKNQLNDQMFLKNYISHRIEKREQRNKQNAKEIKAQLEILKNWLSPIKVLTSPTAITTTMSKEQLGLAKNSITIPQPTTGISKAVNDGVFVLNNINPAIQQKSFMTKKIDSLKFSKDFIQNPYTSRNNGNKPISYYINQTNSQQITQTLNAINGLTQLIKQYTSEKPLDQNDSFSKGLASQAQGNKKQSTQSTFFRKNKQMIKNRVNDVQSLLNQILKPYFVLQNAILSKRADKNLEWWRQKQRVMSKRKSSRKKARFKTIKASFDKPNTSMEMNGTSNTDFYTYGPKYQLIRENIQSMDTWNPELNSLRKKTDNSELPLANALSSLKQKFSQKFRKKASSKGRRYRNLSMNRGFAYVRKPKNVNGFANIPAFLESFDSYGFKFKDTLFSGSTNGENNLKMLISKDDKVNLLRDFKKKLSQTIIQSTDSSASWSQQFIKNAPAKKRSKRTWKRRKRQKFARNHLKYRKRNIHGFGKIRVLAKKLKRIKNTLEFQNWWWNSYLPNFVGSRQSSGTITSSLNSSQSRNKTMINDISFKPLSTSQALDIKSKLQMLPKETETRNNSLASSEQSIVNQSKKTLSQLSNNNLLDDIYNNFLTGNGAEGFTEQNTPNNSDTLNKLRSQNQNIAKYNLTTNLPFYAGWDESLRKFVVTNRFLSRRETGSIVNLNGIFGGTNTNLQKVEKASTLNNNLQKGSPNLLEFNKAPIKGLNEGSFLYLQTDMPFNSYTIDQFIPNNQSFYAPLGWKRFQFRHSQLKNWLTNHSSRLRTKESSSLTAPANLGGQKNIPQQQTLRLKTSSNLEFFGLMGTPNNIGSQKDYSVGQKAILTNKRIKKRYKLLKQTPMQLMYVPTGSLLTETLPSHYISVFDKQYRFPRNRFLKRSLLKDNQKGYSNLKDLTILEASTTANKSQGMVSDFTLRKRVKPRRKYHKKRFVKKEGLIFPRRRTFTNIVDSTDNNMSTGTDTYQRLRPSTKVTTKQSTLGGNAKGAASKKRGPKTNPIRLRQLRRREFSQIIKPLQRFQPRYGGFTWPGDYLKLEIIPMPKLEPTTFVSTDSIVPTSANTSVSQTLTNGGSFEAQSMATDNSGVSQSKRKISVQPVGILPRKYLLQKHNLKIFKKKLSLKYGK